MNFFLAQINDLRLEAGHLPSCLLICRGDRVEVKDAINHSLASLDYTSDDLLVVPINFIADDQIDFYATRAMNHPGPLLIEDIHFSTRGAIRQFFSGDVLGPTCRPVFAIAHHAAPRGAWYKAAHDAGFRIIGI